ncbi:unnamed protein product, partial [Amoebophrya sp. A25]
SKDSLGSYASSSQNRYAVGTSVASGTTAAHARNGSLSGGRVSVELMGNLQVVLLEDLKASTVVPPVISASGGAGTSHSVYGSQQRSSTSGGPGGMCSGG